MIDYTPKQVDIFIALAGKRGQRDKYERLMISLMGARGDIDATRKMLRSLED